MMSVLKGGSWFSNFVRMRVAERHVGNRQADNLGFRIAKRVDRFRAIRSNSWISAVVYCQSAHRYHMEPVHHFNNLGFRIARRKL